MRIGQIFHDLNFDRKFVVEDIFVHIDFDGLMETHAIVRYIGGHFDGKTNNITLTAERIATFLIAM